MRKSLERGFTLIELLLAITIFALVAAGATALLSSMLDAHTQGDKSHDLHNEGLMIMERLVTGVKTSTHLFIPNAQNTPSNILAFSGYVNEDNDYYFNDPLFPRIDEDPAKDLNLDSFSGIGTVDDDGDGSIDENDSSDDDEDGQNDEDKMDGIDNDGDGNIDEDPDNDVTGDGVAGIKGIDDDGDGSIDEGNFKDNDEDGNVQEDHLDALVYQYDSGTGTLSEWASYSGQTVVLSTRVTSFQVTYETPERIMVTLTLAGDQGEVVTFSEYIFIENAVQRLGKRVR